MPIRRSPASRSTSCLASSQTRSQIAPTVRHATRIGCATADCDVLTANHAVWCRGPARASAEALPLVKPGATALAQTATIALAPARPDNHVDVTLIADLHVLDDRALQAQQPRPYPCAAHVASAPLDSDLRTAGTLGAARRAPSPRPLRAVSPTNGNSRSARFVSLGQAGAAAAAARCRAVLARGRGGSPALCRLCLRLSSRKTAA